MTNSSAIPVCADTIVWDAHAGVFPSTDNDLELLNCWHESGVNHVSINVGFDVMDWQQTMRTLKAYQSWLLENSKRFVLASTIADVARAKAKNKLSVAFDIEGMNSLNQDIGKLEEYHRLGVRQMLFAYNLNNAAAGGCHDSDAGLTGFGREIVDEMNRLGMIIDCSHASRRTSFDIMERSKQPVVFTHSNPAEIWPHQRNICDEQIRACADTGGVIGVNGMGIFLGNNDVRIETILKHVLHLAELVGPQHIGFGLDYSPPLKIDVGTILASRPDFWPAGNLYDTPDIKHVKPDIFSRLATKLPEFGFSEEDMQAMFGQNFYRVAAQVWQ